MNTHNSSKQELADGIKKYMIINYELLSPTAYNLFNAVWKYLEQNSTYYFIWEDISGNSFVIPLSEKEKLEKLTHVPDYHKNIDYQKFVSNFPKINDQLLIFSEPKEIDF